MLWRKSWLETRVRFWIGLAILLVLACGIVFGYSAVQRLLPLASSMDRNTSGPLGAIVSQAAAIESTYRGYVWYQWFRQNLCQTWTLFALLLGTGGLTMHGRHGGALYTLSLPVSRTRIVMVRAATGLAELAVLAFIPSLAVMLLSPGIGQSYAIGDVLVHGVCLLVGGAAFFSLTVLLSTQFADIWSPPLLTFGAIVVIAFLEFAVPGFARYSVFQTMSGQSYQMSGTLPWAGLAIGLAATGLLLAGAAANIRRRDF
jgi:ABC-type transport system involved in multi-copper enzyme maturation permease subunit